MTPEQAFTLEPGSTIWLICNDEMCVPTLIESHVESESGKRTGLRVTWPSGVREWLIADRLAKVEIAATTDGWCPKCYRRMDAHTPGCQKAPRPPRTEEDRQYDAEIAEYRRRQKKAEKTSRLNAARRAKLAKTGLPQDSVSRRAMIFVMHANGISYREIGAALGITGSRACGIDRTTMLRIEDRWVKSFRRYQQRADLIRWDEHIDRMMAL